MNSRENIERRKLNRGVIGAMLYSYLPLENYLALDVRLFFAFGNILS